MAERVAQREQRHSGSKASVPGRIISMHAEEADDGGRPAAPADHGLMQDDDREHDGEERLGKAQRRYRSPAAAWLIPK